jgi:protein-tyrosine phosphatase
MAEALRILATADSPPLVIHCASGKDRTGLLAAIVLSLLGVSDDDIAADFALTGLAAERLIADWHAFYPGRPLLWPHFGAAPAELMRVFLSELADKFGSPGEYVTGFLGVEPAIISDLRALYLSGS